jgi:hypothetical protein
VDQGQPLVTNLRHTSIEPDAFGRAVLRRLDGSLDEEGLIVAQEVAVARGEVTPPAGSLGDAVREALGRLARSGLLWSGRVGPQDEHDQHRQ